MTSFAAYIPATPKGRWSVALGVALLAHVSVGGGVAQWGYGGTGAGEEEAIQIELPPLTKEELAAAPKFVPVQPMQPIEKVQPEVTPTPMTPIVPQPVPMARPDTPADAPVLPTPTTPTPAANPVAAQPSAAAASQPSEAKGSAEGTASNAKAGDVPADAQEQAALEADYKSIVRKHLSSRRFTPQQARKAGVSGSVKVQFVVDRSGAIRNVTVAGGSGHAVLDQEAVAHIQKFARVPGYPKTLRKAEIAMQITLKYDVERK